MDSKPINPNSSDIPYCVTIALAIAVARSISLAIALKEAMNRLSDRERHILNLRFFEGKTQMEVSAEVGISQAQVSRLEKSAINQIKKNL